MDEITDNLRSRKELLKHLILQLHKGEAPQEVRKSLVELLRSIPYNEVVQVEQELINEGLPEEEVLKFCDIHTQVLEGHIDQTGAKEIPPGHPVDTFKNENKELKKMVSVLNKLYKKAFEQEKPDVEQYLVRLKGFFNDLSDVEKHYQRKEELLFPYLEKYNITAPPKVMWGKHDETRVLLKAAHEGLKAKGTISQDEVEALVEIVLKPASQAVADMIMKEEEILFPMCMDKLSDEEWYRIGQQSVEIGFCLFDPRTEWKPEGIASVPVASAMDGTIQLPSGKLSVIELNALLNTLPVEVTFVDSNDKVKYFSRGRDQIFRRTRAVLGRDVRLCHPPKSVHLVERIISDFRSGKENKATFWLEMNGMFVYIEYYAIRDEKNKYLGTLEAVQNIAGYRKLKGEQRLISYGEKTDGGKN